MLNNQNKLFFQEKLWIQNSESLKTKIMQEMHDFIIIKHSEWEIILTLIFKQFYWSECAADVQYFTRNCDKYQVNIIWKDHYQKLLKSLFISDWYWHEISINFIKKLWELNDCKHLLVIIK